MNTNTVALVTGAGSGIGAATTLRLLDDGRQVVAIDRDEEALHAHWNDEPAVLLTPLDITDETQVEKCFEDLASRGAIPDRVVNAAGIYRSGSVGMTSPDDVDLLWRVNVHGTYLVTAHATRHMTRGAIVNISSTAAFLATETNWAYGTTKGAINSLTSGLAVSLAPRNIRVNAVAPGPIATPMADVATRDPAYAERMHDRVARPTRGTPEDIADAAAFLLSDRARWITGQTLVVDGGLTVVR
ncbi:oxidoreductase (plasmid) [Rhodococcus jostii RHA1]|uniref:Oxidoreductase n=2 Tax=Rhodococcus TaxID=1827 RepID=Q0RYG2_RHOJR|nr:MULTISPECIES: SDR family oxidoreductase [Rhodococcus]ABG99674.1 oxidoreductase [Rhodococcus jostii RHA1]EID76329.1 oxidoreductase [Rhodococcus opacus RKJ300 = JCM 13270]QQZ18939.1 SDR family oxidoreductase [Rhodococcus sp. 21391]